MAQKKKTTTTKAKKTATSAATTVEEVLRAAGWEARRTETESSVAFDSEVAGNESIRLIHAELFTSSERLALLFIFRKKAPKARRAEMAELITRANYGMITGGLEMDIEGGEVRYRFGIDFTGATLHPLLVRNAILSSLDAIELYEQAVLDVMAGRASPKEAIAAAEAGAQR